LVKWRAVFRSVLPAALIFIVTPIAIILAYLWRIGFDVNLLLAMILLFQLYLIAIQTEISLKQTTILTAQYNPALVVGKISVSTARERPGEEDVSLRNVGEAPAYNVFVGVRGPVEAKPASSTMLDKDAEIGLFIMDDGNLPHEIEISVLYSTSLGEMKEAHFVKMPGQRDFYLVSGVEKAGFFLDQLERLRLAYVLAKYERRRRKLAKGAEKE
jgi:hypothetical protein